MSAPDRAVAVTDLAIDAPNPATVGQSVLQLRGTWRFCAWPNWMTSHQGFGLYFGIWKRCCGALLPQTRGTSQPSEEKPSASFASLSLFFML